MSEEKMESLCSELDKTDTVPTTSSEIMSQFNDITLKFIECTAEFTSQIASSRGEKSSVIQQIASSAGPKWEAALADLFTEED